MKVYKENIERFNKFYYSDFYKILEETEPDYIPAIFARLSEDPDACDPELYQELGEKFGLKANKYCLNDNGIRLAADSICARKPIYQFHKGEYEKWVRDYGKLRGNLDFHLVWPKHKLPTINTYRYTIYRDRIDCLLYDLKMFFQGEKTPMNKAYVNGTTKEWLARFENFPDFVNKMQLNRFVDDHYNVYDISKGQGKEIILECVLTVKEIKDNLPFYLNNLINNYFD
ncbi:DUF6994 family protein [Streptococcus massiliensis]|uniref:Uncharacterized protein n=1 Tax=Streptococcus massiliensis TaxID=313439 RepID=A0A380KVZ7_9STRE|nr:hypothetical protein [Streptococcus massiliensis]SUN76113.1 Uncharacterised protein [Streptococcus massiliensis]